MAHRPTWRTFIPPFIVGAVAGVLVAHLIHEHSTFIFLDDRGYDAGGWKLAQAWRSHQFISPQATAGGDFNYGYLLYIGAVYFVFGHHPLLVCDLNAVITAGSAIFAGLLAVELGGPRLGKPAAWLVALYPTSLFWGATALKDGPLESLLLAGLLIAIAPLTLKRLLTGGVLVGLALLIRPPLAVVLIVAMSPTITQAVVKRFRPRGERHYPVRTLIGMACGAGVVIAIGRPVLRAVIDQFRSSSASELTLPLTTVHPALPSGYAFVHALLSPLPWTFNPGSVFQIYPGMVIWILALPAAAIGSWHVLSKGTARAKGILLALFLYALMYLLSFSESGFARQRWAIEPFFLILGLQAFSKQAYWAEVLTAGWLLVCGVAAVTMGVAPLAGFATLLLLAALWFATGWRSSRRRGAGRLAARVVS